MFVNFFINLVKIKSVWLLMKRDLHFFLWWRGRQQGGTFVKDHVFAPRGRLIDRLMSLPSWLMVPDQAPAPPRWRESGPHWGCGWRHTWRVRATLASPASSDGHLSVLLATQQYFSLTLNQHQPQPAEHSTPSHPSGRCCDSFSSFSLKKEN